MGKKARAALAEISDVAAQCLKRAELAGGTVVYSAEKEAYLAGKVDAYMAVYRRLIAILGLPDDDYTVVYEKWPEEA